MLELLSRFEVEVEATALARHCTEEEVGAFECEGRATKAALEEVVEAAAKEVAKVAVREILVSSPRRRWRRWQRRPPQRPARDPPRGGGKRYLYLFILANYRCVVME
jgi:hypothetical protein